LGIPKCLIVFRMYVVFCGSTAQIRAQAASFLRFLDHIELNTYTHTHTHTLPLALLWTIDQPVAQASTYATQTKTTDEHPCSKRDSNLRSQQSSANRPTFFSSCRSDIKFVMNNIQFCWPCGLGSQVRIPLWARIFVSCVCCVLCRCGLCDGLITRPEECYRCVCVSVCVCVCE
jgi:hypothetical protein